MTDAVLVSSPATGDPAMKRDMDLIRRILIAIEDRDDAHPKLLTLDGVEPDVLSKHVWQLHQAGFIDGTPSNPVNGLPRVLVRDLTWNGHEFLGTIKIEELYGSLKKKLSPTELASMSFKAIGDISLEITKSWLRGKLGLPG